MDHRPIVEPADKLQDKWWATAQLVADQMMSYLSEVAKLFTDETGITMGGPQDTESGEDYEFVVWSEEPVICSVSLAMVGSGRTDCCRDNDGHRVLGVNFRLEAIGPDTPDEPVDVVLLVIPYNYTPFVWIPVDSHEEVQGRLSELMDLAPPKLVVARLCEALS